MLKKLLTLINITLISSHIDYYCEYNNTCYFSSINYNNTLIANELYSNNKKMTFIVLFYNDLNYQNSLIPEILDNESNNIDYEFNNLYNEDSFDKYLYNEYFKNTLNNVL